MSEYKIDKTGTLEEIFNEVIEESFEELKCLKFQYVWRKKDKVDKHGLLIQATVFKLSPKMRDLHGYDVQVEVHKESFPEKRKLRKKLAYHELKHIELKKDEDGAVALDKQGRIKYILVPHDIAILRFKEELEKYGFDSSEEDAVNELIGIYKRFKEKQKEKRK